jgi:four helix bundle protein
MREHGKLRAFELADELALVIYRVTRKFPKDERYGLTSQMRRATVSIPSNIVEGCGRTTQADYRHFLEIAFGSLRELIYQASLSKRLGYIEGTDIPAIDAKLTETERVLAALIRSLRE